MFPKIHVHTVDKELARQNRQDPITGEIIQLNDQVVFCACCQSVFFPDSWQYIGGKHCDQTDTLATPPSSQHLTVRKPTKPTKSASPPKPKFVITSHIESLSATNNPNRILFNTALYRLRFSMDIYTMLMGLLILATLCALIWISTMMKVVIVPIWIAVFILVGTLYIKSILEWTFKKHIIPYKNLEIHTNRVLITKKWKKPVEVSHSNIKKISFYIPKRCNLWSPPLLYITLKNGSNFHIKLAALGECRRACLEALAHISQKTQIKLTINNYIDTEYAAQLKNLLNAKFL